MFTQCPALPFSLTALNDCKQVEADSDIEIPPKQPVTEVGTAPQTLLSVKTQDFVDSDVSKQKPDESNEPTPPAVTKSGPSAATLSPTPSTSKHHESGALLITDTTYVIPKKQAGPQPPSSEVSASVFGQKPPSAATLMNEPRNLLVPPAPSAPSSRPSQPNNQVRQSIQRSLTSILFKR